MASAADWIVVQAFVTDALVGCLTPDVSAIVLFDSADRWVVKYYLVKPLSESKERDLIEAPGDAQSALEGVNIDGVKLTDAAYRPIRAEFILDRNRERFYSIKLPSSSCRVLFVWDWSDS